MNYIHPVISSVWSSSISWDSGPRWPHIEDPNNARGLNLGNGNSELSLRFMAYPPSKFTKKNTSRPKTNTSPQRISEIQWNTQDHWISVYILHKNKKTPVFWSIFHDRSNSDVMWCIIWQHFTCPPDFSVCGRVKIVDSKGFPIVTSTGWTSRITLPYCKNIAYIIRIYNIYDLYNINIYIHIIYIYIYVWMSQTTNLLHGNQYPSLPIASNLHLFWSPVGLNASEWTVENRDRFRFPIRNGSRRPWSSKPIYQSTGLVVTSCLFFWKNLRCWEIIPSFPQPKASIPFICLKTHCFESWTVRNELKQFSALVSSMKFLETWNGDQSNIVSP